MIVAILSFPHIIDAGEFALSSDRLNIHGTLQTPLTSFFVFQIAALVADSSCTAWLHISGYHFMH